MQLLVGHYIEVLIPQLLKQEGWDELQIWENTLNVDDQIFISKIATFDPRIRVVKPPQYSPNGAATIGQFFRYCTSPDVVYIRFDDDICFLEQGLVKRLADFRWKNKEPFLITPVVINSAIFSYLLKICGKLNTNQNLRADCLDPVGWKSPIFAEKLHRVFLDALANGKHKNFHLHNQPIAVNRFSINCISWLGSEFATFNGEVPYGVDEEEFLSVTKPSREGRYNMIMGNALVSHFAFFTQREHLDQTDILEKYKNITCNGFSLPV